MSPILDTEKFNDDSMLEISSSIIANNDVFALFHFSISFADAIAYNPLLTSPISATSDTSAFLNPSSNWDCILPIAPLRKFTCLLISRSTRVSNSNSCSSSSSPGADTVDDIKSPNSVFCFRIALETPATLTFPPSSISGDI